MTDKIDLKRLLYEGVIFHEDESLYHSRSRSGEMMSSHRLIKFRECPYRYFIETISPKENEWNDSLRFGSAFHARFLEGEEAYRSRYPIVEPPINPKTGKPFGKGTNAYNGHYAMYGDGFVTPAEDRMIVEMKDCFWNHPVSEGFFEGGETEVVCRRKICGVDCQIRIDLLMDDAICDVKTCADIMRFERDAFAYGYPAQLAFYRDVLEDATGVRLPVYIFAFEKSESPICGIWRVDEELLDEETVQNRNALEDFRKCRETGVYPTGFETVRVLRGKKKETR